LFIGYSRQEIPILKNRKVVAMGQRNALSPQDHTKRNEITVKPNWEYISDEIVLKTFQGKAILLSSYTCELKEFYDKYKLILNIKILNDSMLNDYINCKFDVVITASDIWPEMYQTQNMNIFYLYRHLLTNIVSHWLEAHNVRYYEFQPLSEIRDIEKRWSDELYYMYSGGYGCIQKNGYLVLPDIENKSGCNIVNNERITTDVPENFTNSVYIYGPCLATGSFVKNDRDTIESLLQREINDKTDKKYRVVNKGVIGWDEKNHYNFLHRIIDTTFKEGDIVVTIGVFRFETPPYIEDYVYDTCTAFTKEADCNCFIEGDISHFDIKGNKIYAKHIFETIKNNLEYNSNENATLIRFGTNELINNESNEQLQEFLESVKQQKLGNSNDCIIGAIVMNCNPFTLGHQYLIEEGLKIVDYLYVFVVEENKSFFSFEDRFAMVKSACEKYDNVKVLPSGRYMISSLTFLEYFEKDALQDIVITPTLDVELFAAKIAPAFDKVTAQYNLALKEILPQYGINIIEIPRCKSQGEIVSASLVRKAMANNNYDDLIKYLPETSFNYITNKQNIWINS